MPGSSNSLVSSSLSGSPLSSPVVRVFGVTHRSGSSFCGEIGFTA